MFNKTIALVFALATAVGFTQSATAAEASAAPATVIVYRADESVKTRRLKLDISADNHNLGTLRANNVVVAEGAAGQYTLGTSMAGTEPLTLDLKPGATYYIHTDLKMRGSRIYVSLHEVSAQVARVQQPALEGAI